MNRKQKNTTFTFNALIKTPLGRVCVLKKYSEGFSDLYIVCLADTDDPTFVVTAETLARWINDYN